MTSQDFRPQDREALSALFDGELDAEARRFALRRLGHDADWQRDCGRWQLVGDALRRQAPIAAPADFAGRVAAAIASEQAVVAAPAARPQAAARGRSRARWIGGALAASVALVAAVSTLRPGAEPAAAPPVVVAASPAVSAPAPAVAAVPPSTSVNPTAARPAEAGGPASGVEPARRLARVDRAAPSRQSAARRAVRSEPVPAAVMASTEALVAASFLPEPAANPFNLGTDAPLTARPWPRASLPAAGAAFTARYGAAAESAGDRPSFYPFEPRLPAAAEPVPSP